MRSSFPNFVSPSLCLCSNFSDFFYTWVSKYLILSRKKPFFPPPPQTLKHVVCVRHVKNWDFCNHSSDGGETSEYYQDGVLSEGPQLPHTLNRHCAVEVEPGFVFISGNSVPGFEKTTLRFDPSNGTFKSLPDMTYGRYRPGCGVVRKGSS